MDFCRFGAVVFPDRNTTPAKRDPANTVGASNLLENENSGR
jgi:hypothetical protein